MILTRDELRPLLTGLPGWIPLETVLNQAEAESSMDTEAVNAHSGAAGLWQFMEATWRDLTQKLTLKPWDIGGWADPESQCRAIAHYWDVMRTYLATQWQCTRGEIPTWAILAAHNWGMGNVARHCVYGEGWAANRDRLPAETRNYVAKILGGDYVEVDHA